MSWLSAFWSVNVVAEWKRVFAAVYFSQLHGQLSIIGLIQLVGLSVNDFLHLGLLGVTDSQRTGVGRDIG